jgi:anti-anti-sigma regulatory factor
MRIDASPDKLIVKPVPEAVERKSQRAFVQALAMEMSEYRPRVVLDCSGRDAMDRSTILLMLCCLEEALKRNGDVRLAGISPAARAMLEDCKADRVFQMFSSKTEAIESFSRASLVSAWVDGQRGGKERT